MTYKTVSDLSQRRARQLWLADLQGAAWEELPPDEQRANLVKAKQSVSERIKQLPRGSAERRELGLLQHDLDERISAIRPKIKGIRGTAEHFVDVAKERLTPFQFNAFMREAISRVQQEQAA
jgi:hypothetical protein